MHNKLVLLISVYTALLRMPCIGRHQIFYAKWRFHLLSAMHSEEEKFGVISPMSIIFFSDRLSDADGSMKFSSEKTGKVSMGDFDSQVRQFCST